MIAGSDRPWIVRISVPQSNRCVANEWRSECSVTLLRMLAAASVSWNRRLETTARYTRVATGLDHGGRESPLDKLAMTHKAQRKKGRNGKTPT